LDLLLSLALAFRLVIPITLVVILSKAKDLLLSLALAFRLVILITLLVILSVAKDPLLSFASFHPRAKPSP
jgi:hypothetical protein